MRGKKYIYRSSDLLIVHNLFVNLYENMLKPLYGEADFYDFEYDKDLQMFKIKKSVKNDDFYKKSGVLCLSEKGANWLVLLLDSLAVTGVVNAPFYHIKITFSTKRKSISDVKFSSLLISKPGKGEYQGYYDLKGAIK